MAERLAVVNRTFSVAVDLLTPTPVLADALRLSGKAAEILRVVRKPASGEPGPIALTDGEALPLPDAGIDLIVSALGLQYVNDLPGVFAQIRRALKPDGLFLAVLLGGDTLTELRQSLTAAETELRQGTSPRVLPFAGVREIGALLQRGEFALPVADQERVTTRYRDAVALMRDLRAMGATNILRERSRKPLTKAILGRAAAIYAERFSDPDGRIRATFDLIWLSGWAPHESQQRALRPGSAKQRLADALGAQERPAGEKAGS
jgi:SAM-dependent methyltransferase